MSADDSRPAGSGPAPRDERSSQAQRRTFVLTDADGTVTRYEHFVEEDRIRVLMMDGRVVDFRPERAKGQPTPKERPGHAKEYTTTYCYDPEVRLHSIQEPGHSTTITYVYDAEGTLRRLESGDS